MCLIVFSFQQHADFPLVLAANRDENYARPTRAAQWWEEEPGLLAGKDLEAGGTWLGVTRSGRFAAITNHRNPPTTPTAPRSRGMLTLDFLTGRESPGDYLKEIAKHGGDYAGFNLLVSDSKELYYYSNIEAKVRRLEPGSYGLSNALLDTPWPKLELARNNLNSLMSSDQLSLERLQDTVSSRKIEADDTLPNTGVGIEFERLLSAQFIVSETYGTRATTSLMLSSDGDIHFMENRFSAGGLFDSGSQFNGV